MSKKRDSITHRQFRKHIHQALAGICLGAGFVAAPVYADDFLVKNANDSGPGSLRQAFLDANATPISGSGYHTIESIESLEEEILILNSPLPVIVGAIDLDIDFANTRGNYIATPITVNGNGRFTTNVVINGLITTNDDAYVDWRNSAIGEMDDREVTIAVLNDDSVVNFESMSTRGDVFINDNATLDWNHGTAWGQVVTNDNSIANILNIDVIGGNLVANENSRISMREGEILPHDDDEYGVVTNDSAQIKLEEVNVEFKDVQANDNSLLWLVDDRYEEQRIPTIGANAFANDQATIYLQDATITGNATFNNSSILRSSGDSHIHGTTTLAANAILAPDVMNDPLVVNHLELNNSKLQPWFHIDDVPGLMLVGETYNFTVLEYTNINGTFDPKVLSPLDVGITSDSYSSGAVKLYLKSNQVNLNKLLGSENAHALGGYFSKYFNSTQTPGGDLDLSLLATSNTPIDTTTLLAIAAASRDGNLNMLENTGLDVYSTHNAQAYWNQKSFIDSIKANSNDNPLYGSSETSGENPLYKGLAGNASATNAQLASLRQTMTNSATLGYAVNDNDGKTSSLWATYNGNHQSTDADSGVGSSDWSSSTNGYTVGFTNGGDKFSWGVAAGHQDSDLNFSGGNGEQEGWNMGLYGSLKSKSTYITGILGYGKYDNDIYDGGISSFDTQATSASLEIGKHLSNDRKGGFTPYASVLWTKIKQDNASGDDGLLLKNGSNNVFTTELGLRYNHRMFDKSDSLKGGWMAGLSWLHQGGDTGLPVNIGFSGAEGSAAIKSTPLAGNSLRLQLGAYGRIHGNLIGFAGYQGTFGSSQKINAVNAGIGYQF